MKNTSFIFFKNEKYILYLFQKWKIHPSFSLNENYILHLFQKWKTCPSSFLKIKNTSFIFFENEKYILHLFWKWKIHSSSFSKLKKTLVYSMLYMCIAENKPLLFYDVYSIKETIHNSQLEIKLISLFYAIYVV